MNHHRYSHFLFLFVVVLLPPRGSFCSAFVWPEAVSNRGPYSLTGTVSNYVVLSPSGDTPTTEDLKSHRYHHHTRISYHEGVIYLAFTSGLYNESEPGNKTVLCVSTNKGVTWSDPVLVVPEQSLYTNTYNLNGSRISYVRNFTYWNNTNWLICSIDQFIDDDVHVQGMALMACACNPNGSIGTLYLISTNDYTALDGLPVPPFSSNLNVALMDDSVLYGVWGGDGGMASIGKTVWSESYWDGAKGYVEKNTFSVDGGSNNLYRIWRVNGEYVVYQNSSSDGGSTWSAIEATTIPNSPSETTGLRLTTGQYAILGNPYDGALDLRDPLFLALTASNSLTITNVSAIRQGITNVPVYAGHSKYGGASYVSAVQVGNYLYVAYSVHKENIEFSRVLIPGLQDNNNDTYFRAVARATTGRVGSIRMSQ